MNLYVVRHGQTDWNKEGILLGNTDKELNEKGQEQAFQLKKELKRIKFDCVITSPLDRTKETAKIITDRNDIIEHINLKERNYGELEGTKPKNINKYWKVQDNLNDKNVEPIKIFLNRVFKEIDLITQEYKKCNNVLIVTHYGVIMAIDAYFNERYEYCFDHFVIDNCEYKKYSIK